MTPPVGIMAFFQKGINFIEYSDIIKNIIEIMIELMKGWCVEDAI
jgi:hypothetical protein